MFDLWQSLKKIQQFSYISTPGKKSIMNWAGAGEGSVTVSAEDDVLYFQEKGRFALTDSPKALEVQNEYIWQRIDERRIRLQHSRFGRDNIVDLFDLIYQPATDDWRSEEAHVCGDDLYTGKAYFVNHKIHFYWSIVGPRKDEHLYYCYSQ